MIKTSSDLKKEFKKRLHTNIHTALKNVFLESSQRMSMNQPYLLGQVAPKHASCLSLCHDLF